MSWSRTACQTLRCNTTLAGCLQLTVASCFCLPSSLCLIVCIDLLFIRSPLSCSSVKWSESLPVLLLFLLEVRTLCGCAISLQSGVCVCVCVVVYLPNVMCPTRARAARTLWCVCVGA